MAKNDINMADWILTPCNVAYGYVIVTVNSPSGSFLQCDTWLCDDMSLNLPKRPPYWNSTSGFDFDHITAVNMSFCSLRNFIQIGPPSAMTYRFSRWRNSAILDFMGPVIGSLESPCATSYRSSVDSDALNCLVFEKIAFFGILATDRQTDRQHRCTKPLSLSRAAA